MKKKSVIGLKKHQTYGLFLIILGFLIWIFRPLSHCNWYNIFCQAGSLVITPIFVIIAIILIIAGVWKLLWGEG